MQGSCTDRLGSIYHVCSSVPEVITWYTVDLRSIHMHEYVPLFNVCVPVFNVCDLVCDSCLPYQWPGVPVVSPTSDLVCQLSPLPLTCLPVVSPTSDLFSSCLPYHWPVCQLSPLPVTCLPVVSPTSDLLFASCLPYQWPVCQLSPLPVTWCASCLPYQWPVLDLTDSSCGQCAMCVCQLSPLPVTCPWPDRQFVRHGYAVVFLHRLRSLQPFSRRLRDPIDLLTCTADGSVTGESHQQSIHSLLWCLFLCLFIPLKTRHFRISHLVSWHYIYIIPLKTRL